MLDAFSFDPTKQSTVRYSIDADLWKTFSREQVSAQFTRLVDSGRAAIVVPKVPFTIRVGARSIYPTETRVENLSDIFYDFEFEPGGYLGHSRITRFPHPEIPISERELYNAEALDRMKELGRSDTRLSRLTIQWIKDVLWLRDTDPSSDLKSFGLSMVLPILVILLHDARVHKVEVEPKISKLHKLGIGKPRPQNLDIQQITLHIPKRIYTGDHGGTHASPRLHYRAEHERTQPYGPRSSPAYKEITIAGTWISAADLPGGEDGGTPIIIPREYRLKL